MLMPDVQARFRKARRWNIDSSEGVRGHPSSFTGAEPRKVSLDAFHADMTEIRLPLQELP
ncbi:unannotated protein [freshwater metagenome]|uniref:Unannotated protein n=1 Tax=freshwater metagenome TaxID=449393 RepID=A0A6J7SSF0_9ZZZZ